MMEDASVIRKTPMIATGCHFNPRRMGAIVVSHDHFHDTTPCSPVLTPLGES